MTKKTENKQENYAAPIICAAIVVIALLTVVVASVVSINGDKAKQDDNQSQTEDEDAVNYSVLTSVGNQDVLDFLSEKKTGFLYVGRPTCSVCQVFAPILTKVVEAENYEVFYYDTDAANDDKELKSEVLEAISVTSVPTFMYIENGVEVERLDNTSSEEKLREFIQKY